MLIFLLFYYTIIIILHKIIDSSKIINIKLSLCLNQPLNNSLHLSY